jgi:outer membrane protein assembly factor BamB
MRHRSALALSAAACLLLGLAACGNNEGEPDSPNIVRETAMSGAPELPPTWGTIVPATTVAGMDPVTGVNNPNSGLQAVSVKTVQLSSTLNAVPFQPGGPSVPPPPPPVTPPVPPAPALDITLSNQLPVATPAVVNGRIYVGSGFGSYQMNCIDAATGALIWAKPTQSDGPSAVACDGTYLVFTTESCTLECMECATGNLVWARWLGDPVPAMPALENGKVLAVYPDWGSYGGSSTPLAGPVPYGQVASGSPGYSGSNWAVGCFNASNGACNWVAPLTEHAITGPVICNGCAYVATLDGNLTRVNMDNGTVLSQTSPGITSTPTAFVNNGQMKLAFSQRIPGTEAQECLRTSTVSGTLDPAIGTRSASYLNTATVNASGYFGNNVFSVLNTENCYWLMPSWSTGQYANVGIGSVFAMSMFQGSRPVVGNGRIYAAMGNKVVAHNLDGSLVWEYSHAAGTSWRTLNPPALAGGKLVLSDTEGAVLVLNADTGALEESWNTGYHIMQQPAVVDGSIYVGSSDGHVIVIPTGNAGMTGWTQWGGNSGHNK